MKPELTKEEAIDEAIEFVRKAMKANYQAKQELVDIELKVGRTHTELNKAKDRLRGIEFD
jgi:hypothetical protein